MTATAERIEIREGDLCEWCGCGDQAVAVLADVRLRICDYAARSTVKLPKPTTFKPKGSLPVGHIYFIQAGNAGPVKIGWSLNPTGRRTYFQTGHYEELRTVHTFKGTVQDERTLHRRFKRYQIRNEWFKPIVLELVPARTRTESTA